MTTAVYFPIRACSGVSDQDAALYHQRWLVVDDSNRTLSSDEAPELAQVEISLRMGYLVMRAPGMLRLDVPLDVIEDDDSVRAVATLDGEPIDVVDEGSVAATWFSNVLGRPCRLVKIHPDAGPAT